MSNQKETVYVIHENVDEPIIAIGGLGVENAMYDLYGQGVVLHGLQSDSYGVIEFTMKDEDGEIHEIKAVPATEIYR